MSWSHSVVGSDKAKLKQSIRDREVKDDTNPHSGIPHDIADKLCAEIDRCRIYEYSGKRYGLYVQTSGSWHDQGYQASMDIRMVEVAE